MTTDGGGWTLVAGIDGTNANHVNAGSVTPGALVSPSGFGKYADAVINALKSGTQPGFRLTCRSVTGYFPTGCIFAATTTASGPCTAESYVYANAVAGTFGTGQFSQGGTSGLADGDSSSANRLIYGYAYGGLGGCDTASTQWGGSGTLWVR